MTHQIAYLPIYELGDLCNGRIAYQLETTGYDNMS